MECSPKGDKKKDPAPPSITSRITPPTKINYKAAANSTTRSDEKLEYMGIDEFVNQRIGLPGTFPPMSNVYCVKDNRERSPLYHKESQSGVSRHANEYGEEIMLHVKNSKKIIELEKISKNSRGFQELFAKNSEYVHRKDEYDYGRARYASSHVVMDRLEPRVSVITTTQPVRTDSASRNMPPLLLAHSVGKRRNTDEPVSPYIKMKYEAEARLNYRHQRQLDDDSESKRQLERNIIRDKLRRKAIDQPLTSTSMVKNTDAANINNDEIDVDEKNDECPRKPDLIEHKSSPSNDGLDYSEQSTSDSSESEVYNLDEQSSKDFGTEEDFGDSMTGLSEDKSCNALTGTESNLSPIHGSGKGEEGASAGGIIYAKKRGGGKPGRRRKRGYIYDPKPLIPKTKINTLPASMKDADYWTRRQRNNEAAKRSRENRRVKELEMMDLVKRLTETNDDLRERISELESRNQFLEELLTRQKTNTEGSAGSTPSSPEK